MTNIMRLRAKLRRMQAESVMDPAARRALIKEAEELELLAEEGGRASKPADPNPFASPAASGGAAAASS
jgi:hypothetical protein